jgi:hypothetical protein
MGDPLSNYGRFHFRKNIYNGYIQGCTKVINKGGSARRRWAVWLAVTGGRFAIAGKVMPFLVACYLTGAFP